MVQITSEPRMPIGISRLGFFDSCAAVETASKPIYAKKITPAPRSTPDQPNSPKVPVFGGRNGVQFTRGSSGCFTSVEMPITRKITSTVTLMATINELKLADYFMPI